ncbi:unnamed protein product, partial [Mesorhabditis belari]|uniref:Uncharacterized protein n=1 Tax=Mesorhabditis belari TaxID=2138241 RepID=A0AAF3FDE7_9BILA
MTNSRLNSQADDFNFTFTSNSASEKSSDDPKVKAPSQARSAAKQLTILLYEYKDDDLSTLSLISEHPVISAFASYITDALTSISRTSIWQTVLETVALVDAYEMTLKSNVCHRLVDELVVMGATDQRCSVRMKACYLMKEVLTIEEERELGGASMEEEEEPDDTRNSSNDSTQAIDSFDEDSIDLNDIKYPKVRSFPKMSAQTLRSMHWTSLLERLRRDKETEVRGAAIESLAHVSGVQIFVDDLGSTAKPDDLVLDHLFDPQPTVRAKAVDSFSFTFAESMDRTMDALETEKDVQVRSRLLRRFLATSLTYFDTIQALRLLKILYADDNEQQIHEKWRKCILSKWLTEIAQDYNSEERRPDAKPRLRVELLFKLIDPIVNKDLANKIFPTIASICQENAVGKVDPSQWMKQLRDEDVAYFPEDFTPDLKQYRLTKETIGQILENVAESEMKFLARRLFVHRSLIDYLQRKVSTEDPSLIAARFLPDLCTLAKTVKNCVQAICRSSLVKNSDQRILLEFIVLELCNLMRQLDTTEWVGRLEWRTTLMVITKECHFLEDRDSLARIMQDMVDDSVDDKKEALSVADEIAYMVHIMLTESNENSQTTEQYDIDMEAVPRCAILLEALLRNTTIDTYSSVLKNLVLRLVELATSVDTTRPIGCKIIAIAACMDDQILAAHAHILAELPTKLPDEIRTSVACLTGIAELVLVRGLVAVASAFYADLDPDSQADDETKTQILRVKITRIVQLYENAIINKNRILQLAGIENGLRLMVTTGSKWSTILSRSLLTAFTIKSPTKAKAMTEAYVSRAIGWNKNDRGFMAASMVEAVRIYENWPNKTKVDLSALFSYGLLTIRLLNEEKVNNDKSRKEAKTKVRASEPDFVGELAFLYGMLDHCARNPDSELCLTICTTISNCLSLHRHRRNFSSNANFLKSLLDSTQRTIARLAVSGQKEAVKALMKLHNRFRKLNNRNAISMNDSMFSFDEAQEIEDPLSLSLSAANDSGIFVTPKSTKTSKRKNCEKITFAPAKSPKKEPLSQIPTQNLVLGRFIL